MHLGSLTFTADGLRATDALCFDGLTHKNINWKCPIKNKLGFSLLDKNTKLLLSFSHQISIFGPFSLGEKGCLQTLLITLLCEQL